MTNDDLLSDYWTEDEWAKQRRLGVRTMQRERRKRTGAPFVKNGKSILYPKIEAREWMRSRLVRPVRRKGG
jgi:hypothetical protein